MSNSINNIKQFFDRHQGLQRPNRFSIEFNGLPPEVSEIAPNSELELIAAVMGVRSIDVMFDNLSGYGFGRSVPRSTKFPGGVMLTFPVTGDNFILRFFQNWFNSLFPESLDGRQVAYYDNVVRPATMKINVLDLNGNKKSIFTFYEVYPLETLPLEFKMADNNTFLTHTVMMNFRNFKIT